MDKMIITNKINTSMCQMHQNVPLQAVEVTSKIDLKALSQVRMRLHNKQLTIGLILV